MDRAYRQLASTAWGGPLTGTDLRLAQFATALVNDAKAGEQLSDDDMRRLFDSMLMAPEVSYVQPAEKPAEETS